MMFQVTRNSENRIDIDFTGKLNTDQMKTALDDMVRKAEDIEQGRMLYRIGDFELPTLGALGVELSRLPQLFRLMRKFDRVAVIAGKNWLRKISEFEGKLIPGLQIRAFSPEEETQAESWLEENPSIPRKSSRDNALNPFILERDQAVLVVVDVQERLVPAMDPDRYAEVLRNIDFVLKSARLLEVPVVGTEQYPRGIGHMVPELSDACRDKVIEKLSFGCCGEPSFIDHMNSLKRRQAIVVGMEAHVCVYQTVLGLLREGYDVHLVRDGIMSRGEIDYQNALELSRSPGAVVTTSETAVFQLVNMSSDPHFKEISAMVKARSASPAS